MTQTQYKYIFLDINMPEMDGVEMVQLLREKELEGKLDFSNTMIFALTAFEESALGDIHKIGFDHYLSKPLQWDQLQMLLEH